MRIGIVTPAPARSSYGNRITAVRWAKILKRLGHRVSISQQFNGEAMDALIALHARRSHQSIKQFRREYPEHPIVVALTGTDVYRDLERDHLARESLELATRIVALQPKAVERLNASLSSKTRIIFQSVEKSAQSASNLPVRSSFDVCVIAHLRPVKDPFRAVMAARLVPGSSRIRILQIGGAITNSMAVRARAEAQRNPRYQWLGELSRSRVHRVLAKCSVCVISSRIEGGANVLSEAIVAGVPVLASRIDGNVGILGDDYPGLFNVDDTSDLANLLHRSETDADFLRGLRRRIKALDRLFDPKREQRAWMNLIREMHQDRDVLAASTSKRIRD